MAKGHKTGGRARGTPNKATADIKALAQKHGEVAIETLAGLMTGAESEVVQVAAARELLDRGYGKPAQTITGADGGPIEHRIIGAKAELDTALARLADRIGST